MSDNHAVQVIIPTPLRRYTNDQARVSGHGATVGQVFDDLEQEYPGLKERICDPDGQIRRFVNVFINGENVRDRDGADTPVNSGDEIGIIPAMAGGRI
ncbi:MAG TPA: ubiquitin-like small modifier protein 1 [Thermomicrobiales bacterium]|jgi:molybdopterin converting factor small subunit|nr:ubiquitin-like small modifier protein 1 [Thermomicrobiales bacterium]